MTVNTSNELKVASGGARPNSCSCNLQDGFSEQAPQAWREPHTQIGFHLVQKQEFKMASEGTIRNLHQ